MGNLTPRRYAILAALLLLTSFLLLFVISPAVPGIAAAASASSGPCAHVLRAPTNGSGPTVECFVNATASYSFEPNVLDVPANSSVVFSVGVTGSLQHTFTLDSLANDSNLANWTAAPSSVSPPTLSSYFANHTAVNLYLNSSSTIYTSTPVHLSKPHGIYYYVCLVPGHFEQGMFGALYEGIAPPTPVVTPTYTAPIQTGILVAALALIGASALFIYAGQRIKFPKKAAAAKAPIKHLATGDEHTLSSWIFTTDHKRIGILYLITASYFFLVAGSFALMMRTQLAVPDNTFIDAQIYNQLVTMHGLLMALFVISPLGFAFANYVIPLQIGARDMSFPRLNALSYWFFLSGGLLLLSGIYLPGGAISTGWTVYAPLSETQYLPQAGVSAAGAGILLLAASMVLGTVNIGTTIFRQRAKGYKLLDLPAFTWAILFTLGMAWVAFPDLAAAVGLLVLDRTLGSQIFLSQAGGALLWEQMFWFFGHPEVYILILPAFGAMYDIASVFAGQPIFQKKYVIYSMLLVAVLSMGVWLHHMFLSGVNLGWLEIQSVSTGMISIPSDTLVLGLMFTLIGGRIRYKAPMLFTVGAIPLFIIGGITGVLLSVPALNVELHGAYWVVAHFHYMLAGSALWGLTAAMYYFFPKITGRMYNERLAQVHFLVAAVGVNTLYFPMFFLFQMPRRYYIYSASLGLGTLNTIATIGAFIYGTAQVIFAINLLYSWRKGPKTTRNPWGAWGFEWLTSSPPPPYNFEGTPKVVGNQLVIEPMDHTPHAPQPSIWPMMVGVGSFLSLFGVIAYEAYGTIFLMPIGFAIFVVAALGWAHEDYSDRITDMDTGRREVWPFGVLTNFQLGTLIFISGDLAFVGAIVSSWFFVIWQAPYFNDPLVSLLPFESMLYNQLEVVALVASCFTIYLAYWAAQKRDIILAESGIVATLGLGLAFLALTLGNWQIMARSGMGLDAVSTSLTASFYYDFTLLHIVHLVGIMAAVGYYAFRLPKIIRQRNTPASARALDDDHQGSAFDGLSVVTWLWIFVAVFGLILMGVFMFA